MDERLNQYNAKMKKTIENLKEEYITIRAGRANPHLLDKIKWIIMDSHLQYRRLPMSLFRKLG